MNPPRGSRLGVLKMRAGMTSPFVRTNRNRSRCIPDKAQRSRKLRSTHPGHPVSRNRFLLRYTRYLDPLTTSRPRKNP